MKDQGDEWAAEAEPQPTDDTRVLRGRPECGGTPSGVRDYAAAILTQDAAWWAALSDDAYAYSLLRALESASARGAPLHLARCSHHVHALLRGLDPPDRAWTLALLRRIQVLLARRAGCASSGTALPAVLAYLAAVGTDPRFAPPPALPVGLLHAMYPHGVRPAELGALLDRQRYPRGKALPACPVCELAQADPTDPLVQTVAALPGAERAVLVRLGEALALEAEAEAPDLREQVAWLRGAQLVPAAYQAALAQARQGGADPPRVSP